MHHIVPFFNAYFHFFPAMRNERYTRFCPSVGKTSTLDGLRCAFVNPRHPINGGDSLGKLSDSHFQTFPAPEDVIIHPSILIPFQGFFLYLVSTIELLLFPRSRDIGHQTGSVLKSSIPSVLADFTDNQHVPAFKSPPSCLVDDDGFLPGDYENEYTRLFKEPLKCILKLT